MRNIGILWPTIRGLLLIYATSSLPAVAQTFVPTGSMASPRWGHAATLLNNGKVLIVGGCSDSLAFGPACVLASAELYDPASGTFIPTGSMTTPRGKPTATLLGNGKVLIAGGHSGLAPYASAELYDPATGIFTATGSMTTDRHIATATLLNNGKVLVAGGWSAGAGGTVVNSAELYDPSTGAFTATGSMTIGRQQHEATRLNNGKVLIAGGSFADSWGADTDSAELYDPTSGTFVATGSMTFGWELSQAILLNSGKVLVAGGWSIIPSYGGKEYADLYDPAIGTFTSAGSMTTGRYAHTGTLLSSGSVLLAGGGGGPEQPQASAELYDPAAGTFTATGSMSSTRKYHGATLLTNGRVLITGGTNSEFVTLASAELYNPPNQPPIADAGVDQTVVYAGPSGTAVTLDGSASSDPDGDSLTYNWSGPFPEGGGTATGVSPTVTLPLGESAITLIVNDGTANSTPDTVSVSIEYRFSGFMPPVANLPTMNEVNAGRAIPLKWSLGGYQGTDIFASGFPASGTIPCDLTAGAGVLEPAASAGNSGLDYNASAGQYTYVWKTEGSWAGSCRQLVIKLKDGTDHRANFGFTK